MKKILLFSVLAAALAFAGCTKPVSCTCRIHGTTSNADLNGKRIFLVPLYGPQDAAHVDSVVITDGKFEFATDTAMMAKILVDYHYRLNVQTLLVVTEPGDIQVVIGENSSAVGTPQNDSLQLWKNATEAHNAKMGELRRLGNAAQDSTAGNAILQRIDSIHLSHKKYTRALATHMKEGLLHDFLSQMYPLTYRKKLPDGTVQTIDSDTKEILKEEKPAEK